MSRRSRRSLPDAAPLGRPGGAACLPTTSAWKASASRSGRSRRSRTSTCSVAQGEFVCFLGPSGCGKTTLLRIIAGLETQTAGRILQGERDISVLPPAERDYGIVFQSYALFPNLSVAENVAYGLVNRKVAEGDRSAARVDELLEAGRPARQRRQVPGAALGRPAAAHRAGARARDLARPAPARRAAVGARRARARAPAPGDPLAAANARRDDDHGDARPGGGALGRRPDRRHEPGRDRADRHADADLSRPGDALRRRLRRQDQRALGAAASRAATCASARAGSTASTTPTPSARSRSTSGPRTCWRGRSRPAMPTSSTARSTRSSSSARTASSASAPRRSARSRSPSISRSTSWPSKASRSAAACR